MLALFASTASGEAGSPKPVCGFGDLQFDSGFPGGRITECRQTGRNAFTLGNAPESRPINPSPWYAFRILSERRRNIEVFLHYGLHGHRYRPKVSQDGETWQLLDQGRYAELLDGRAVRLRLQVGPNPLHVAAQEIIDNQDYDEWRLSLAERADVTPFELGRSVAGRPIHAMTVAGPGREWVLIVGRQHPPEVTGAMALFPFVEAVLGDAALGQRFRQRFNLLLAPNLNPDGVANGHWRHNLGGVDLNRDWGPFTQPETQAVNRELQRLFGDGAQRLVLGLDFHSTHQPVFYTQLDGETPQLPQFTARWLAAIAARSPDFPVNRQASANAGRPVFKHYISETYGIPAITYEMGDQTERPLIRHMAVAAAEEMMRILLDSPVPRASE